MNHNDNTYRVISYRSQSPLLVLLNGSPSQLILSDAEDENSNNWGGGGRGGGYSILLSYYITYTLCFDHSFHVIVVMISKEQRCNRTANMAG
jgi:hypothetical protein